MSDETLLLLNLRQYNKTKLYPSKSFFGSLKPFFTHKVTKHVVCWMTQLVTDDCLLEVLEAAEKPLGFIAA